IRDQRGSIAGAEADLIAVPRVARGTDLTGRRSRFHGLISIAYGHRLVNSGRVPAPLDRVRLIAWNGVGLGPFMSTSVDRDLAAREASFAHDPERVSVITAARRFKASWFELGELLSQVRRHDRWKAWGHANFD